MHEKLKDLFARRGLRIGAAQRDLLVRSLADTEVVAAWDDEAGIRHGGTVIVDEPPRLLRVDAFCRSLPSTATVVIPQSENPAFDFLKSKLHRHGLIGACAPESPHQIWWGGPRPIKPTNDCQSVLQAHLISCVRQDTPEEEAAVLFEKSLTALNISHSIARNELYVAYERRSDLRSSTLLDAWGHTEKPLIWLDPHSTSNPPAVAIDLSNADFAAILTPDGTFSTNFLYFGRSRVAFDLLQTWNNLAEEFPTLASDHLLDAAWSLVTSQRTLVTLWLDPYSGPGIKPAGEAPFDAAFAIDTASPAFDNPAQREARKAGRSAAPEPQCVLNSRFGGRGPLTLTILSEGATARKTADTMHSAVDAFSRFDGGFSSLGIVICRNEAEVETTVRKIGDGFFLCLRAGVVLDDDIFRSLYDRTQDHELGYAMHRYSSHRQTRTGTDIAATQSQAVFFNSILSKTAERSQRGRRPALKVVSE